MARRPRNLSPEEAALWDRVARTAKPLAPEAKSALPKLETPVRPKPAQTPLPGPVEIPGFRIGERRSKAATALPEPVAVTESLRSAPVTMDKKAYKRMARGKLSPEDRIDLHGMTLDRAHPALIGFILRSHGAGLRLVLVITGKGKDRPSDGPIPERRGVLKHQVPGWLRAAPCGPLVMEVQPAHQSHGGEGAYYVYLRRSR
ncbi:MAG: Smr/MutS family protein [Pseudomonadota bacterium]